MQFNRIFRERALQYRARQEPLDDRLQITAPHEWLIVAGLGAMLIALIVYGVLGRVERTVSYDAVVLLPGEHHHLVAPASGTVADVLVEVTDTVSPGDPVAYVQTTGVQHRESVILEITNALEMSGQLEEEDRQGILKALSDVGSRGESASQSAVVSPRGGEVVALDIVPGQVISAGASVGLVRTTRDGEPEVVAFVTPDDAVRLKAGMAARVRVGSAVVADERIFQGRVTDVSKRAYSPPGWLSNRGLAIPRRSHRLGVTLVNDGTEHPLGDLTAVSLQIVLGQTSLASLLAPGGRD